MLITGLYLKSKSFTTYRVTLYYNCLFVKVICAVVCWSVVHVGLVIACYITGTLLEPEQKKEMIRYLRSVQCPDGGWGL